MSSRLFQFGEEIDGYPVRVLNERAVRAAAGLLLLGAMVSFGNAMLLGNFQPTRLFVLIFLMDMGIRVFVNPLYAPSMIVGGWVVRHQTPDWSGAPQKRFAWVLGLLLGLVMAWTMVLHQMVGPINMLVCATCLTLMFFETAFGICLGCKLYNLLSKNKAQLCPGGVCDVPLHREPRPWQWGKAVLMLVFAGYVGLASQWVRSTAPVGLRGFDDMATLEDMGVQGAGQRGAVSGESPATEPATEPVAVPAEADAQRCQVPEFAKALGHEQMWKQHHHCL